MQELIEYQEKYKEIFSNDNLFIQERENIIQYYWDDYEGTQDCCGEDGEEAEEAKAALVMIMNHPIIECRKKIIEDLDNYCECMPEHCLQEDKDTLHLLNLFSPRYYVTHTLTEEEIWKREDLIKICRLTTKYLQQIREQGK